MESPELRKVYKVQQTYTETEIKFAELRAGDMFRFDEEPSGVWQANSNPEPCSPEGNFSLEATPLRISTEAIKQHA